MSWYAEQFVPRMVNLVCATPGVARWRRLVVAGLHGSIVEIGFGSGLNVAYYPSAVERVYAIEPHDTAWRLAQRAIAASPVAITRAGLDGQHLSLDDSSCDGALSTFTLCTVGDDALAARELYRVLKPGASCTCWSTASPPTSASRRGSDVSTRSNASSPTAAT